MDLVPLVFEGEVACSLVLGKLGMRPPWPAGPDSAAEWQLAQDLEVLRSAELMVISPSARASVMAAAALEPGDFSTISRDRDIVTPTGLATRCGSGWIRERATAREVPVREVEEGVDDGRTALVVARCS